MSGQKADIISFEGFEHDLHEALSHLYDPIYRPTSALRKVLNTDAEQGSKNQRASIIRAIEELSPEASVPVNARVKRVYETLIYRYVQNLSQEETAERLGITSRHLRRGMPEVLHALALYLWEKHDRGENQGAVDDAASARSGWQSQVKEELASLNDSTASSVASVSEIANSALGLVTSLASRREVQLVASLQPGLVAAIHPVALRQVLITAIGQLIQIMSSGQITIRTAKEGVNIRFDITGEPAQTSVSLDKSFILEILDAHDGTIAIEHGDNQIHYIIDVRSAAQTILVVDDNFDLAHLYHQYALGTPYNIIHVAQGLRTLDMVETYKPAAIVLDVMLPDIDGWLLLSHLHEDPSTCAVPVIVCSVVREEELARALGARLYLQKPVQRNQFLTALNDVLNQVEAV
jgi:CheY-like chemotaxis protein